MEPHKHSPLLGRGSSLRCSQPDCYARFLGWAGLCPAVRTHPFGIIGGRRGLRAKGGVTCAVLLPDCYTPFSIGLACGHPYALTPSG